MSCMAMCTAHKRCHGIHSGACRKGPWLEDCNSAQHLAAQQLLYKIASAAGEEADLIERGDVQDVLDGVLALKGHQRANLQLIICTSSAY